MATPRLTARRLRYMKSELTMLQKLVFDSEDLLSEYNSEYALDMAHFKELLSRDAKDSSAEPVHSTDPDEPVHGAIDIGELLDDQDHGENFVEQPEKKVNKHPSWAKKIYRKIAMLTHPDKIADDERAQKLRKIFEKASQAIDSGKYEELAVFALELGLSTDLDDESLIPIYQKQIKALRERSQEIEKSMPWIWGESFGVISVRKKILSSVLRSMGLEPSDDELVQAIKDRENN